MADDEHVAILKKGVDAWNAWRDENLPWYHEVRTMKLPGLAKWAYGDSGETAWNRWCDKNYPGRLRPDLRRANLRRRKLSGADLSVANLREASLHYANLQGANLIDAMLGGANLTEADLTQADLTGANLSTANLTQAKLIGADLRQATLYRANLSGARLRDASLAAATLVDKLSPRAGEAGRVRLKLDRDGVPIAPFSSGKGSSLKAPIKAIAHTVKTPELIQVSHSPRSFANVLPRIGAQNAIGVQ